MSQNQSRIALPSEIQTPSQECLGRCLKRTALLFSRALTAEEGEDWKNFLSPYSAKAIEYAFDHWNRNGRFFPKPKDILELADVWVRDEKKTIKFVSCGVCDEEGWIRIYEGKTAGGHQIGKLGALQRCECWLAYARNKRVEVADRRRQNLGAA